jgi:hypothetical protein
MLVELAAERKNRSGYLQPQVGVVDAVAKDEQWEVAGSHVPVCPS